MIASCERTREPERKRSFSLSLSLSLSLPLALAPMLVLAGSSPAVAQTIAITNARIHTVSGPVIERGTVVIERGRIAAVGPNVSPPAGARILDGTGKVVTPGFLDSFTQLGVVEIGAVDIVNDIASRDDEVTAAFNVAYGLDPYSSLIPIARTGGITRAIVAPQPGGSIVAGQAALIKLQGTTRRELVLRNPAMMYATLDGTAAERAGGSRGVAVMRFRELLQDARDYARNREAYEGGNRREYALSRLDLEAMVPVIKGELPLALRANRASDILTALELTEEFGLDMVLIDAVEAWMVADQIARAGVPVILNPMTNIPGFDALGATLENAARLDRAGVRVVFATFDAHNARNLRQSAGNAVSYGMPYDAALRAITAAPAALWGIAERFGTIEPGKDADLVVWSGDPFELLTGVEHVFIQGQELDDATRQRLLLERYRSINESYPQSYRRR